MKKSFFRAPFQLMLFAALAFFFVGCRDYTPGEKYDKGVDYVSWKLDLTDIQRTYLEDQKEEILSMMKEGKTNREFLGEQVIEQLSKDRMDESFLMGLVDTQQKKFDQYAAILIPKLVEFHAMLTPDQRAELLAQLKEHHEKRKSRHGNKN